MTAKTLEGHLGTEVQIDFCGGCQVFWFDHLESLRLSPAATLGLFRMISDRSPSSPRPIGDRLNCPRCDLRLLATSDRQRNTPFKYWRCAREHGRLISFFDFLREKDFIRPLSPQQLVELRRSLQTINCSNCGAPIDIVHASACAHCGTPISMLDVKQISEIAAQAQAIDQPKPAPDIAAIVAALQLRHQSEQPAHGLVETGLELIGRWLSVS
jgi:hypothetical protein